MAYSRFGDSGAYILRMFDREGIICMACRLTPIDPVTNWYGDFVSDDAKGMLKHIEEHKAVGHQISSWGVKRLKEEAREELER